MFEKNYLTIRDLYSLGEILDYLDYPVVNKNGKVLKLGVAETYGLVVLSEIDWEPIEEVTGVIDEPPISLISKEEGIALLKKYINVSPKVLQSMIIIYECNIAKGHSPTSALKSTLESVAKVLGQ